MKFSPAFGLLALSALALVGDAVAVLTGHGTVPLFESVVLAGLTGGAAITIPSQPAPPAAAPDTTAAPIPIGPRP